MTPLHVARRGIEGGGVLRAVVTHHRAEILKELGLARARVLLALDGARAAGEIEAALERASALVRRSPPSLSGTGG